MPPFVIIGQLFTFCVNIFHELITILFKVILFPKNFASFLYGGKAAFMTANSLETKFINAKHILVARA